MLRTFLTFSLDNFTNAYVIWVNGMSIPRHKRPKLGSFVSLGVSSSRSLKLHITPIPLIWRYSMRQFVTPNFTFVHIQNGEFCKITTSCGISFLKHYHSFSIILPSNIVISHGFWAIVHKVETCHFSGIGIICTTQELWISLHEDRCYLPKVTRNTISQFF